jgi:hypothetical protein
VCRNTLELDVDLELQRHRVRLGEASPRAKNEEGTRSRHPRCVEVPVMNLLGTAVDDEVVEE